MYGIQCKATILKENRRCKIRDTNSGYCKYHGPKCQAKTNSGNPCKAMVLKFRLGYIYCDCHESISPKRHLGPHDDAAEKEFEDLLYKFDSLKFNSGKTTTTTT